MRIRIKTPEEIFKKLVNTKKADLHIGFLTMVLITMLLCFILGYASVVKENYETLKVYRNNK